MSFITLNGWVIPVRSCVMRELEIGDRGLAHNGNTIISRRAIKRRWDVVTTPISRNNANALIGVVQGKGHKWGFDADLFGDKGEGPANSGSAVIVRGRTPESERLASNNDVYYDENGVEEALGGGLGAVHVGGSATNILDADQRDCEGDATPFTAIGTASLVTNTGTFAEGAKSLQVTTNASGDGFETDNVSCSSSTAYVGTVYLKALTDATITVTLIDDDTGTLDTAAVAIVETISGKIGSWRRVKVSGTTGGSAANIKIRATSDQGGGTAFWVDKIQIEALSEESEIAAWADPTQSAGDLEYDASLLSGWKDLTLNCWVKKNDGTSPAQAQIVVIQHANSWHRAQIRQDSGGQTVRFSIAGEDVTQKTVADAIEASWKMLTLVVRRSPLSGENAFDCLVNGVIEGSEATLTSSEMPDWSLSEEFWVGNDSGAQNFFGAIDDLAIYPFAAPAAMALAWYNLGAALPALPTMYLAGDAVEDDSGTLRVVGKLNDVAYVQLGNGSSWENNRLSVSFSLTEF